MSESIPDPHSRQGNCEINAIPNENRGNDSRRYSLRNWIPSIRGDVDGVPSKTKATTGKKAQSKHGKEIRAWLTLVGVMLAAGISFSQAIMTREQLIVMQDQEIRQLRAYVFVNEKTKPILAEGKKLSAELRLEIIGQTPVYNMTHVAKVAIKPFPLLDSDLLSDFPPKRPYFISVPPGKSVPVFKAESDDVLRQIDIERLTQDHSLALYTYGRLYYEDAFSTKRCMRFCFMHQVDANSSVSAAIYCNRAEESGPNDYDNCK